MFVAMVSVQSRHFLQDFAFLGYGMNIQPVHQPQNRFMIHANPFVFTDPDSNPSITVGLVRLFIGFLGQLLVLCMRVGLLQLLDPDIVNCSRNTKKLTHRFYRVFLSVVPASPLFRFASTSFRNSVWNFFYQGILHSHSFQALP